MAVDQLRELSVLLTSHCNLRCTYCYQDARRPGAMAWSSLRAAIDRLLEVPIARATLSFAGGEAALEWELIRRAVAYARERASGGRGIGFHLVTNGVLIPERRLSFLAEHDFSLELSFDGVRAAQDLRAPGTFRRLDRLLDDLQSRRGSYFASRVAVSTTVARGTIPHLSASFEYFVGKGVRSITLRPAMGQREWERVDLESLDAQLSGIVELSIAHHAATGRVPLTNFREGMRMRRPASAGRSRRAWSCSAPLSRALVVDVDGQVYPCAVFAGSYQSFPPAVDARIRLLSMGDIRDARFAAQRAQVGDACRRSGLFEPKRLQHSGERRCGSCRERAHCIICPLARVKRPGMPSPDPNDIPPYLCAYERVLGRHRRRFLAQVPAPRGEQLLQQLLAERRARGTAS